MPPPLTNQQRPLLGGGGNPTTPVTGSVDLNKLLQLQQQRHMNTSPNLANRAPVTPTTPYGIPLTGRLPVVSTPVVAPVSPQTLQTATNPFFVQQMMQTGNPRGKSWIYIGDKVTGRLGWNGRPKGRKLAFFEFFFFFRETYSVTTQTQVVVTIYFHCIVLLLPFNGDSMCNSRASVRRTYAIYYVQKSAAYTEITHQRHTADFWKFLSTAENGYRDVLSAEKNRPHLPDYVIYVPPSYWKLIYFVYWPR